LTELYIRVYLILFHYQICRILYKSISRNWK